MEKKREGPQLAGVLPVAEASPPFSTVGKYAQNSQKSCNAKMLNRRLPDIPSPASVRRHRLIE
jgi:hypothetical protein